MPPKKDAFSDLFSSAMSTRKSNTMSMAERQKQQATNQQNSQQKSSLPSLQAPKNDSWSDLDFLSNPSSGRATPSQPVPSDILAPTRNSQLSASKTPSAVSSATSLPKNDDPFAIFESPAPKPSPAKVGGSLLDDDFTDLYPEQSQPQVSPQTVPKAPERNRSQHGFTSQPPSKPSSRPSSRQSQLSRTDSVIAELVDIGFSIEEANLAIERNGPNLQACVNYIMNKNSGSQPSRSERSRTPRSGEGIDFNGIGQDLFKSANSLFNKSKQTVMKNLEQFQKPGSAGNSNVPEWMKNQEKYKSDAIEKKYVEADLDYGSDSENFNQEEIERFMRLQREKDKEKAKNRYDGLKEAAMNKIRGKQDNRESREDFFEQPPTKPPRPSVAQRRQTPENKQRPLEEYNKGNNFDRSFLDEQPNNSNGILSPGSQTSTRSTSPSKPSEIRPTAVSPKKVLPKAETETLDIFNTGPNSSPSSKSALRDSSPLNQFDESDYNTSKATAQEAYRTGNYTGALEAYLVCLGKLPSNHENRVIIFSNLGMVNKQVGHLKQSLESVDNALKLIGKDEIHDSKYSIASKPVKYWYTKLITTKAEVLELSEKFEQSLQFYSVLIKELGVVDKKIMDGKRRVDKIVNPENYKAKSAPKPTAPKVSPRHKPSPPPAPKPSVDEIDPLVVDKINGKVQSWSQSKQGNLRSLLTNLDEIIPPNISMKPALRKLTTNELMLPKQVKIQYMKVISSIHPDKLASQCKDNKESELICKGVFIVLNESWESFKTDNSL